MYEYMDSCKHETYNGDIISIMDSVTIAKSIFIKGDKPDGYYADMPGQLYRIIF